MKDLKILSEMTTRYGTRNVNELEFKTPEEFATYKKKHKMRPGTVVKVAGKDKKIGDDKPKGRRMQITMDFQMANKEDLEKYAKKYNLKLGSVGNNPNYGLEAEFEGSEENLKKFMTSDDYGLDEKDFDDYAREYGDVLDDEAESDDKPKEPQAPKEPEVAPVSGEPKVDYSEMEDTLNATLDDVGFGGQDTSGLEDIIYTFEDDLEEAGVLRDIQDDLALLQQIQSDDPSNPEDVPYEERERAVDRIRSRFEKADIIAESVNNLRQLSKITTRYNK